MKIYKPIVAEGFEWVLPIDEDDFQVFRDLDAVTRATDWTPVSVRLLKEDEGEKFAESDFPWLGSDALVLRNSAIHALGGFLMDYGELLPLDCDEAELAVFNVHRMVDALDEERSLVILLKCLTRMSRKSSSGWSDRQVSVGCDLSWPGRT